MKIIRKISAITIMGTFLLVFYACPPPYSMVAKGWLLENNSEDTLSVYMALFYSTYPDTLIPQTFKDGMLGGRTFPNETSGFYATNFEPEETFKDLPRDTLSLFIVNVDTFSHVNWAEINQTRLLQRYDLSLPDLKSLNFTISYPPDGRMKNMKMYPPYGSK